LPRRHRAPQALFAFVLLAATTIVTFAQPGDRSPFLGGAPAPAHPNFDIRSYKADPAWEGKADAADYLAKHEAPAARLQDLAVSRVTGVALLEQAYPGVKVESNPATRGTELVTAPGTSFLTGPSGDRTGTLRGFLAANAAAYGLTEAQVGELQVVADYLNPAGNMGYAEFEQRFNGIPVFQGYVRGGFTAKGELARTTGLLATGVEASALGTTPALTAAQAVAAAAATVGWSVAEASLVEQPSAIAGQVKFGRANMADEPTAWLVYFPLGPGALRLAWATQIWSTSDAFLTVLDAETGTLLFRKNLTEYQSQSVSYTVYPSDSPAPFSPSAATPDNHLQAPHVARQTFTLIGNEAPYTFNNLGWINDGNNTTDGNNVEAGIDRDGTNGVDAPVPGSALRVFNYAYNPETDDPLTLNFQRGDVSNMFYWVNRYHDWTYLLGFNEQSLNFQNDNFGRGGLGADRVSAEGQDSSGTNNANFATPVDGSRGRMQMFLWTGPTPDRSGDLDQDVIFHELTHGLSNRLHGNASGLSTNMARGMGEGWSDFYARALLSTADESVNGIYTVGGYATREAAAGFLDNYYYGIRRFPYAPRAVTGGPSNRPHSPLTFGDIDSTQANLNDGAYPPGPFGTASAFDQVHNIGEVWAGMLWEVRARFITRLGHAVGNQRLLQFVTDGMKLDPAGPTLLQARDAIIAAANAGGGTPADVDDIWRGFATRGLGVLAAITNAGTGANNTRVVESYLTPSDPVPSFSINDVSVTEGNSGTTTATFTVSLANPPATPSSVSFAVVDGTASSATAFTSAAAVTIPATGSGASTGSPATPYPSTITVAGAGTIQSLAVRLNGLSHTFPDDLDVLLVGPGGQRVMLMSDVGGDPDLVSTTLTFRDGAAAVPDNGPVASGTYAPTDVTAGDPMPAPAPAGPYGTALSTFNGTSANGTWSLYISDDASIDVGTMTGWSLLVTTAAADYTATTGVVNFAAGQATGTISVTVNGDVTPEPNETFFVDLSNPVNATIGDAQGVGTIVNDDGGGPVPTTANDAYATPLNTPLVVAAPGVLANDNSNGGGALTAALVLAPTHGALSLNGTGGFTYTPTTGYTGPDSFTYFAVNTFGGGNVATVSLTVGALAPTTVDDALTTTYPTALNLAAPGVLANDNANGGGALTAALVSNVSHGTLTLGANGSVSYTPNFGFAGTDSFTYRAVSGGSNGNVATVTITVAPPTNVQAPYNLRVDSVVGTLVTLRWDALPIGPQASTFVLEGGIAPGQVLASIPTGSPSPIYTFVAPVGSWSIRMHGQLAADKSAASNEVALHVAMPVTPSAPRNLLGLVNGSTVDLAWKNTFEGGPATGLALDVTGSAVVTLPMGVTERFSFTPVPGGTYTFRMRQTNAGGSSAASDPVTLSFPTACTGAPEVPANFLGYRVGNTAFVIWDPPASGPTATSYLLDVTGSFVGTFATTGRTLSGGVTPGNYQVRVQAINACGASAFTPVQTISVP
jgi:subtilisin-like proprotein convertase family protein